jgi:hypothetical protein
VRIRHHQPLVGASAVAAGLALEVQAQLGELRSNAGIAQASSLAQRTVESYVASVFTKLDIPVSGDDNRRVLAVLRWMRATGNDEMPREFRGRVDELVRRRPCSPGCVGACRSGSGRADCRPTLTSSTGEAR